MSAQGETAEVTSPRHAADRRPPDAAATDAAPPVEPPRRWSKPLRFHLSLIVVGLLVIVSAILIGFNFERSRQAAIVAASREMTTHSFRVRDRYRALFYSAAEAIGLASTLDLGGDADAVSARALPFLAQVLRSSDYFDSAYVGFPSGGFLDVVSLENNPQWSLALGAPPKAVIAVRTITADASGRLSSWRFLDADGRALAQTTPEPAEYDPRTRPWYRSARQTTDLIATDPYRMATTGAYGITVARQAASDPLTVFGLDVLFADIEAFLATQLVTPGSFAFIFDAADHMIAQSGRATGNPLAEAKGTALAERTRTVLPTEAQSETAVATISLDGEDYLVALVRLTEVRLLKGGTIASVTPIAELTKDSQRLLAQGLVVSLLVLAVGVVGAVLVANRISRSLRAITAQALRMQAFELEPSGDVHSRIAEVAALRVAMNAACRTISAFSLYVPKELVRRIVGSGTFAGRTGQRQVVTALFTDIKDFTTICERSTAEDVVSMLRRYFDLFSQAIRRHEGVILEFVGDGVYALWNAPQPDPAHADHACRCALELRTLIDAFNATQRAAGAPECITRFGIHTGTAVVGSIGAADRLQYAATGDTINVASRLEGLNKQFDTTILVSGEIVAATRGGFAFRPLGSVPVKGRAEPLAVFELTG
jgi:adenylate cyclase